MHHGFFKGRGKSGSCYEESEERVSESLFWDAFVVNILCKRVFVDGSLTYVLPACTYVKGCEGQGEASAMVQ